MNKTENKKINVIATESVFSLRLKLCKTQIWQQKRAMEALKKNLKYCERFFQLYLLYFLFLFLSIHMSLTMMNRITTCIMIGWRRWNVSLFK